MGSVVISGATSGAVTLAVPDEAGTRTLTLPATTGTILTNDISQAGDTSAGNAAAVGYTSAEGLILTGQGSTSDITFKNDADTTVFSIPTGAADVLFPDGARALFGAGSDLQIFHDGSNSYITEAGTGALIFKSNTYSFRNAADNEQIILASEDGAVTLYHNNVAKLATSASGVTATGTLNATTSLDSPLAAIRNPSDGQLYLRNSSSINRIDSYDDPISATYPLQLNASQITFFIADAEKMRIHSDGKVGIGTTAPTRTLTVIGSAGNQFVGSQSQSNDTAKYGTYAGSHYHNAEQDVAGLVVLSDGTNNTVYLGGGVSEQNAATVLAFHTAANDATTGGTERMRITSGGIVQIAAGSASPTAEVFRIGTNSVGSVPVMTASFPGNAKWLFNTNDTAGQSGGRHHTYFSNGGEVGSVTTTTSATAYNTSSDYRLKENVSYTFDATTRLKQLKPARFNFKVNADSEIVDGFLAHEVSSIVPEAITGAKDAVDGDGNPVYQSIDQSKLVPLLVKTIQELEARITALEAG